MLQYKRTDSNSYKETCNFLNMPEQEENRKKNKKQE